MEQELVCFLDAGGGVGLDDQFEISDAAQGATVFAEQGDDLHLRLMCLLGGEAQSFAVAAGGKDDQHVTGAAVGLDLAGEDPVESKVIGNAGDEGWVGGEGEGGQGGAVGIESTDEFLGEVHGVCGAAAVADGQHFLAADEAGRDGGTDSVNGVNVLAERLNGRGAGLDRAFDGVM